MFMCMYGFCFVFLQGLGKTVQVSAYLLARALNGELRGGVDGPALIVCPATLIGHWLRELRRWGEFVI
jgi:SNF2 family DNA or RNA helicase